MGSIAPGTVVFVIDDDAEVRQSVLDLLAMEGYDARELRSADAAWTALALGARPAAIVLDRWLFGMGSFEFVRRLRASEHARIPVLLLSGAAPPHTTDVDVDAVVRKPAEATSLVRKVDALVGSRPKVPALPPARKTSPRRKRTRARARASTS